MTACLSGLNTSLPYIQLKQSGTLQKIAKKKVARDEERNANQRAAVLHVLVPPNQQNEKAAAKGKEETVKRSKRKATPFSLHLSWEKESLIRSYTFLWSTKTKKPSYRYYFQTS
jgi:hypothetical protein